MTLGRLVFGTAVLAAAMVLMRRRLPRGGRTWAHLTVAALLLSALSFSLFAHAELTIPSTLAGIRNATSPLGGMVLSLVALSEDRPTRIRVAGLGLGFLGVLTVLGAWQGCTGVDPTGTALALPASLSYPIGWTYVRHARPHTRPTGRPSGTPTRRHRRAAHRPAPWRAPPCTHLHVLPRTSTHLNAPACPTHSCAPAPGGRQRRSRRPAAPPRRR
ncbi:hypothetical protein GCM10020295_70400 [Streptomyces cinereospinus]